MFVVTVFLFLYTNPILAVLYIFVAYELIRRSNDTLLSPNASYTQHPTMNHANSIYANTIIPTQHSSNVLIHDPIPPKEGFQEKKTTLEEYMVNKMAPIGNSNSNTFLSSSYQPVCDPVGDASLFCSSTDK
jgi:hypothetical protein